MKRALISWVESTLFLAAAYYGTIGGIEGVYRILCLYIGISVVSQVIKLVGVAHPEILSEEGYKHLCGISRWKRWKSVLIDFSLMFAFAYLGNIVLSVCMLFNWVTDLVAYQNATEKIKAGCEFKKEDEK